MQGSLIHSCAIDAFSAAGKGSHVQESHTDVSTDSTERDSKKKLRSGELMRLRNMTQGDSNEEH